MPRELTLLKFAPAITPREAEGVLREIQRLGGEVKIVAGRTLIIEIDSTHQDLLRKHRCLELVGGVNFRGRKIKKIRQTTATI